MTHNALGFFNHTSSAQANVEQALSSSRQLLNQITENIARLSPRYDLSSDHALQFLHNRLILKELITTWDAALIADAVPVVDKLQLIDMLTPN